MEFKSPSLLSLPNRHWLWILILVVQSTNLWAIQSLQELGSQTDFTEYKGEVLDSKTKDPLAFATLVVSGSNISTITNSNGEFLLKVPDTMMDRTFTVSLLGYQTKTVALKDLNGDHIQILLAESVTQLSEIKIKAPKDALSLVKAALDTKGENYSNDDRVMTAFYRETIKKRRRDASLSEAVVEIFRRPHNSIKPDKVKLIKARKSTDYTRLDTLAVKLQGGPFSALYADIIKYPEFVFTEGNLSAYIFTFDTSTEINNRPVYVVNFKPHPQIIEPMHYGKIYIDVETYSLVSAVYNLNVENKKLSADLFVRKKPNRVTVYPTEAAYRVDYRYDNGKWYYGYSNIKLTIKVNWKGRLFNSLYTLNAEMAITDWEISTDDTFTRKETIKPTVILSDEASGFSDPEFWGEYNIIEPEKSIESAIEKINKQLEKRKSKGVTMLP